MVKFLIRRILFAIPVLLALLLVTFTIVRLIPGGPFDMAEGKTLPPEIKAALESRYGLDKPLFLNFPSDGSLPDDGKTTRLPYQRLPSCDKLRQGLSASDALPKDPVVTIQGWHLLYWFEEHNSTTITIKQNGKDKSVPCDQATSVLYSDLTRSQFFEYLDNLLRFNFGPSLGLGSRGQEVGTIIAEKLPISMRLGFMAVIVGFFFGLPIGVLAALRHNTGVDRTISFLGILSISTPSFVLGPGLRILVANQLHWLPAPRPQPWVDANPWSWAFFSYAILPVISLSLGMVAGIARLTRASLLEVLDNDYIRTARSKGLRERGVIFIHALKNAMIPVATILGPLLAGILVGTLFVEQIFSVPGLGSTFVDSIDKRDYNLLLGVTLLYGTFLILGNILVDIMYTWLDPRIRFD